MGEGGEGRRGRGGGGGPAACAPCRAVKRGAVRGTLCSEPSWIAEEATLD